jgi:hypothetical protein
MFYNLQKFKRFLKFLTLLRVEPFVIFLGFCLSLRRTPLDLLIQDKLCRLKYNLSENFCRNDIIHNYFNGKIFSCYLKINDSKHEIIKKLIAKLEILTTI